MTQPTTHPAAIPALVGVSIGITAGFAGEIARTAGVSDASIRQVKTGAAAAAVFACSQTPVMTAGAIGGFLAGEKIGRAPTAILLNSGRSVCRAISGLWNRVKTGTSAGYEDLKEDVGVAIDLGKFVGRGLVELAKERIANAKQSAADIANKPICQKALQFSKTTPGKALCAVSAAYAAYAALPFWALAAGVPLAAMAHERANRAPPPPPTPDETY